MTLSDKEHNKIKLLDFTPEEICTVMTQAGFPAYTGTQIAQWIYKKRMWDVSLMSNVSKTQRAYLQEHCAVTLPRETKKLISSDGTQKYLLALEDGQTVEAVIIPGPPKDPHGRNRVTACISSQVGCNMACRFCHTGTQKKHRNLTHGEIVGQILFLQATGSAITNIVFMGMGEPLEDVDITLKSCHTLTHEKGLGFGHRKVTVSTCGLIPGLRRMMRESRVNLAISLHAPNQSIREKIMPISKKYPLDELLEICRKEFKDTRKRITFEYVLLKGINDRDQHAVELVSRLHGVRAKINLLQFNPFPGSPYECCNDERTKRFSDLCMQKGIQTNIRSSRGQDVMAACGQLKGTHMASPHIVIPAPASARAGSGGIYTDCAIGVDPRLRGDDRRGGDDNKGFGDDNKNGGDQHV